MQVSFGHGSAGLITGAACPPSLAVTAGCLSSSLLCILMKPDCQQWLNIVKPLANCVRVCTSVYPVSDGDVALTAFAALCSPHTSVKPLQCAQNDHT